MPNIPSYDNLVQRIKELEYELDHRRRMESRFREDESHFLALLEHMPIGAFTFDRRSRFITWNQAAEDIYGYTRQEALGVSAYELIGTAENRKTIARLIEKVFNGEFMTNLEWQDRGRRGELGWRMGAVFPLFRSDNTVVCGVGLVIDITERRLAQDRAAEARLHNRESHRQPAASACKIDEISLLAAGVAHQFNNKLVGIIGNIDLLKMDEPGNPAVAHYAERVRTAVDQMAHLTQQLLSYSRQGKYQSRTADLNQFVKDSLKATPSIQSERIRVDNVATDEKVYVSIDEHQLQMVITAVIDNAVEAMSPSGGTVRIRTQRRELSEDQRRQRGVDPETPYVCISITDTGEGMGEETRRRMFEPFYSTKLQGRGLGMAAAHGIVCNHSGFIEVASKSGKGSVISIYLPEVVPSVENVEDTDTAEARRPGTILVIDDETVVTDVAKVALSKIGYHVIVAATGREGIELSKTYDGEIAVAVLDIGLPDMDGKDVYPLLRQHRPDMPIIICSGYAVDSTTRRILADGAAGFIQKPFHIEELSRVVKDAIAHPAT